MTFNQYLVRRFSVLLILLMATAIPAFSQTKYHHNTPEDATPTDPAKLHELFSDHTIVWESNSFAYWGADGSFRAVNEQGRSLGVGNWVLYLEPTKLCFEATWFWEQNFRVKHENKRNCSYFVTTADGKIWERQIAPDSAWLPLNEDSLKQGDIYARRYNAMIKELGLDQNE